MALTRGDRFFTADFTPYNLTAWGFSDSQRNPNGPGHGSILGRLLLRGLPGEFAENSTYTWFPLQTPESMQVFLGNLGTANLYSFNRPIDGPVTAVAREYNVVRQILDSAEFRPSYGDKAARVVSGEGCVIVADGVPLSLTKNIMTGSSLRRTTIRKVNVTSARFCACCSRRRMSLTRSPTTSMKGRVNSLSQSLIPSPIKESSLWILLRMCCATCRCTGPQRSW